MAIPDLRFWRARPRSSDRPDLKHDVLDLLKQEQRREELQKLTDRLDDEVLTMIRALARVFQKKGRP